MASDNKDRTAELWERANAVIKERIPESEYKTWFTRINLGSLEDGKITLYANSAFFRDNFSKTYKSLVEDALNSLGEGNFAVDVKIKSQKAESENKAADKETDKLPKVQKDKPLERKTNRKDVVLNSAYTFDSFVPGDNSNFAYSACLAIAKNPGSVYNPCLIYGGVGLGKTHLLQSIGNYVQQNTNLKVMYVTAENFTNEFIQSINDRTTRQFQNKYRKVSVLLIDDIQFLQKKAETQNELFNTFNDLYDTGRQIVFTCDRPVEELKDITDRLRSRFSRGLNIDIQPPDFETRMAILRAKCNEKKFPINNDVLEYIANNISSNVRALESCITKLMAYSTLLQKDISIETAKEQLGQIINSNKDTSGISIDLIIKTVASYYNVSSYDIKGKSKSQSIVLPRKIAMYLCRNLTDFSTTEIASEFGGKNHTTVIYSIEKVESLLKSSDNDTSAVIEKLKNQIKNESKR
ncbi:MAG: chromosomal replication initiator protein DnaA [Sphaerochaetaceae bacterium]|nr:chromosomal replication initiator protein DnaA [Sphaerochaetaceae bacterium]